MGQSYCGSCCNDRHHEVSTLTQYKRQEGDEPKQTFAKPVKQYIDINYTVKQIFVKERNDHIAQRQGKKLPLYYLFEYAAYYDGEWKNGLPHGHGRLIYDDGSIYEGCFRSGTAECREALFIKQNGSYYKGQVSDNRANGSGILVTHDICYKGKWKNDLPHGEGKQIYSRHSYYDGHFVNGKKHGEGLYHWNDKQYYQGQFQENKLNGKGKYVTKQFHYEGLFKDELRHGKGILKNFAKGWEYKGDFYQNMMQGNGVYKFPDGTVFEGTFENNQSKKGKLILQDGQIINDFNNQN